MAVSLAAAQPEAAPAQEPPPLPQDPVLEEEPPERVTFREEVPGPAPDSVALNLVDAVNVALERNYDILAARDNLTSARLRYGASVAQFFPKLTPRYDRSEDTSTFATDISQKLPWTGATLTGSAAFTQNPPETESGLDRQSALSLTLKQPLLRGFGPNATFYDLRNSRRARVGQERALILRRQRTAIAVVDAFYQVLQQRTLLAVARQSLKRNQTLLRASEARLKVGLASKLDVFRAELQVAQASEAEVRAEVGLEQALERFRSTLGLAASTPIEPEATALPEVIEPETEPLEALVARAFEGRLDLQETRERVDDARRARALARQNLLPQLDVILGYTRSGLSSSFGSAWSGSDDRVTLSLSTSYPLERQSERVNAALAGLDLASQERALEQHEQQVEAEVRSALRELGQIAKSVELQRRGVEVAERQHRLATLRYERGLASNFDVVDAEGSLVTARSALVSLLARYAVARLELLRVTGTFDPAQEFAP